MASSTLASASVRVEKATSDLLMGPDWTMNMDICDSINTDLWQAKDVIKAVKKRLQHKNPKVQFLALTLLEAMIKNCGDYVHSQVVERQILQEMVKIVKKKTDMQVREKILVLLDSWQEAFGGPGGKYPQYYLAYMDLKRVGVEFPQRSPDSSLIFSPPGSHPRPTSIHPQIGYGMPSNSPMRLDEAMASDIGNLSLSDLDGIRHVMELLSDMLQAVNPNDRAAVKDELIVDLVSQCHSNQKKLMQLVSSTGDEELLERGLCLNDSLQSLLAKHDAIASGSPLPAEVPQSIPSPSAPFEPIPLSGIHSKEEEEDSEEDEFAQLAHRNRPPTAQIILASETSPKNSDITTAAASSSISDSSRASNALVLSDPPPAVRTSTMEQDMIELLSITLSTNPSPPQTPLTPSTSQQTESPISTSSTEQGYPQNSPHFGNQGHIRPSSYVAPWAQHTPSQPQPVPLPPSQSLSPPHPTFQSQYQAPQYSSSYPPPPWAPSAIGQSNPFLLNGYQYPSTQTTVRAPAPVPDSRTLQYENSFGRSSNASSSAVEPQLIANQKQDSRPLQHYNSFGRSNNASSSAGEAQMTANQRQGSGSAAKPFVPSYRLFEDLIDLRNTDERIKVRTQTSLSGTSSQGMISGRK